MLKELKNKLAEVVGKKENYTLEDCLIAMRILLLNTSRSYSVSCNGEFFYITATENQNVYSGAYWLLGKPLQDQEQETIDLLWDLICKDG